MLGEPELTSTAIDTPGASRCYAPKGGGFFTLGSHEDSTITRFDVDDDGMLEQATSGSIHAGDVSVQPSWSRRSLPL